MNIKKLAAEVRGQLITASGFDDGKARYVLDDCVALNCLLKAIENAVELNHGFLRGLCYGPKAEKPGTILFFPNPQPSLIEAAKAITQIQVLIGAGDGQGQKYDMKVPMELINNLKAAIERESK